jgi:beta-galactosidase
LPRWGEETVTAISPTRGEISLNGLWKFLPAEGATARNPQKGWGYITVPGNWKDGKNIVARGQGSVWQSWKPDESPAAWYERTIRVPADWKGRTILLDVDRVSTDAVIYVNGKEAGQVRWPAGQVDITGFVTPGSEATLRLRVLAVDDQTEVTSFMGYMNEPKSKANLDNRGLIGSGVKLISRPAAGRVDDLLVRPSTRQKKLFVDLEVAEVAQAGTVEISAQMLDEKGNVEKTFTQRLPVQAAKNQTITATFDWDTPRLWDVGQPNMYTMRLKMSGSGIEDEIVQPFGFREFWIEGRRFFFNGTEIQLRPIVLQYGSMPATWLPKGYNFGEIWPDDRGRRGSNTNDDAVIAEADRVGLPISGKAMHMASTVSDLRKWQQPETKAEYRRLMELDVRRWRNHPSVVMWGHSGNVFGWGGDGSPMELGRKGLSNQQEYEVRRRNGWEAIEMIKRVDPVRPVFAHFGTDVGEVYTSNQYLNFIPLQEREDWMSVWAKNGDLPYMAVEFGTPLYASLMRGRDGYTHQGNSEPHLTEWAAVYLGNDAYRLEPKELSKIFLERYKGTNPQQEYEPHLRTDGYDKILWGSPSFAKLQNLFFRNTWRSWRTMGVTGGMIPWHQTDDQLYPELYANNGPSLAWIAGPAGEFSKQPSVPNFTRKDHHFLPGKTMKKQIVLINDHRTPQKFSARGRFASAERRSRRATGPERWPWRRSSFCRLTCSCPKGSPADGRTERFRFPRP